jgi:hypothetical protein
MFDKTKLISYSGFTLDKLSYFYDHTHLTEEHKYPIEQNAADFTIYYGLVLIPAILLKFIKRWA